MLVSQLFFLLGVGYLSLITDIVSHAYTLQMCIYITQCIRLISSIHFCCFTLNSLLSGSSSLSLIPLLSEILISQPVSNSFQVLFNKVMFALIGDIHPPIHHGYFRL